MFVTPEVSVFSVRKTAADSCMTWRRARTHRVRDGTERERERERERDLLHREARVCGLHGAVVPAERVQPADAVAIKAASESLQRWRLAK